MKINKSLKDASLYVGESLDVLNDQSGYLFSGKKLIRKTDGKLYWDDNRVLTELDLQAVMNAISAIVIPTKLSELENDEFFVQDENYVHTDNNFTLGEKQKLAGLENPKFKGTYPSETALKTAYPDGDEGDSADVMVSGNLHRFVWNESEGEWEDIGQTGADSAEMIKTKYESNPDTNCFTDDEKGKLDEIEEGAQKNVQADWNESNTASDAYIKNKPNLSDVVRTGGTQDITGVKTFKNGMIVDGMVWGAGTTAKTSSEAGEIVILGAGGKIDPSLIDATPSTLNLTDEAESDTLPGTGAKSVATLMQEVRNFLKWVKGRFHATTGHKHNGTDSPRVSYNDLTDVPMKTITVNDIGIESVDVALFDTVKFNAVNVDYTITKGSSEQYGGLKIRVKGSTQDFLEVDVFGDDCGIVFDNAVALGSMTVTNASGVADIKFVVTYL